MALDEKDLELIKQIVAETIVAVTQKPKSITQPRPKHSRKKLDKAPKADTMTVATEIPSVPKQARVVRIRDVEGNSGKKGQGRGRGGSPCRVEPFMAIENRPNNFIKSDIANKHKSDTLIDKKLSGNLTPTPRRSEAELWEVSCIHCGRTDIVSPSVVNIDPDDHSARYVCNNCARK